MQMKINTKNNYHIQKLHQIKPPKSSTKADSIAFSGSSTLLQKYDIKPSIEIVSDTVDPSIISKGLKLKLLTKTLEAHEHAQKLSIIDAFSSGRKFATTTIFKNGKSEVGGPIGANAETATCGERTSLMGLWNKSIQALKLDDLKKLEDPKSFAQNFNEGTKVQYLAMSSNKPIGTDASAGTPCSDCLTWMNENKFFSDDTIIASIEPKSKEEITPVLKLRKVKELLPFRNEKSSKLNHQMGMIEFLPIKPTTNAKEYMKEKGIKNTHIQKLINQAKTAYDTNKTTELSGNNNAAAILFNDGKVETQGKFDYTSRWFDHPALTSISNTLSKDKNKEVQAIAYYGDSDVPYISSLGKIAQERGSKDTLVATIQGDSTQVRTIQDYMPHMYISSKYKKN